MDFIKRTIILFFTLGYLLVSGGILLVNTFCSCENERIASVYIVPEHCHHDDSHMKGEHSTPHSQNLLNEVHEDAHLACQHEHNHTPQDCEKSDYTLVKINNPYIDQQKLNLAPSVWVHLFLAATHSSFLLQSEDITAKASNTFVHSPPPLRNYGRLFVLDNHRLKIPFIA